MPVDWLVYAVARCLMGVMLAMPWNAGRGIARAVGMLTCFLDKPSRKRLAAENLRQAFPCMTSGEAQLVVRDVYAHLAASILDAAYFARLMQRGEADDLVECDGLDQLDSVERHTGVIFVTGHFGHWELLGGAAELIGYPAWTIARSVHNPFFERYVRRLREAGGLRVMAKRGSLRRVIRLLRDGQNVAFLIDQDARSEGMFVDFFGRPASTTPSVARIAIRTGAPVAFAYARRISGSNSFRITVSDVIMPDPDDKDGGECRRIVQRLTTDLEEAIRGAPCEWLWLHRRWKTYPGKYDN
jgi:KDO2-lipid IV(A) lauroyltransferase